MPKVLSIGKRTTYQKGSSGDGKKDTNSVGDGGPGA